jgi:tetratricopeptide (TPR) repeat protein
MKLLCRVKTSVA